MASKRDIRKVANNIVFSGDVDEQFERDVLSCLGYKNSYMPEDDTKGSGILGLLCLLNFIEK